MHIIDFIGFGQFSVSFQGNGGQISAADLCSHAKINLEVYLFSTTLYQHQNQKVQNLLSQDHFQTLPSFFLLIE